MTSLQKESVRGALFTKGICQGCFFYKRNLPRVLFFETFQTFLDQIFYRTCRANISVRNQHCVRSVQIRSFFWSEYGKKRTRKNSAFEHFSRSEKDGGFKERQTMLEGKTIPSGICKIFCAIGF